MEGGTKTGEEAESLEPKWTMEAKDSLHTNRAMITDQAMFLEYSNAEKTPR